MKKLLYVLLVFAALGVGAGTGWYFCDTLYSQEIPSPAGNGIQITAVLDDIDYSAIVNLLTEKIGAEKVTDLLNTAGKAVLDLLPQETKDKIIVYLLNENHEKIARMAEEALTEYGFSVKIGLAAENLGETP